MSGSLASESAALAEAIEALLPGWVERSVARTLADAGTPILADHAAVSRAATEAGRRAGIEVGAEVRALLAHDFDHQPTTPLSLLRGAVRFPTAVLVEAGVTPVERDAMKMRLEPDDVYDLAPAAFADVDPRLGEPGLRWGAAKAFEHLRRHAPSGTPR